jgi:hypothetical protein
MIPILVGLAPVGMKTGTNPALLAGAKDIIIIIIKIGYLFCVYRENSEMVFKKIEKDVLYATISIKTILLLFVLVNNF